MACWPQNGNTCVTITQNTFTQSPSFQKRDRFTVRSSICPTLPSGAEPDVLDDAFAPYVVSVTPDGDSVVWTPNTNGHQSVFVVKNTGGCQDTLYLTSSTTGPISGVTLNPTKIQLAPGQSANITATYNVGALGSGVLTVTATGVIGGATDNGSYNVVVRYPYSVAVTPDGEPDFLPPGTGLNAWFVVSNGNSQRTYNYSVACTGVATCSAAPPAQTLVAYEFRDLAVTVTIAGAPGATGTITLQATDQSDGTNTDAGTLNVTVAPQGTVVERSLCLTIAAGKSAAYECGDLRFAHALAPVRTLNKVRAPILLYNSQFAHPFPLVPADVTLPAPDPLPDTVKAILTVNGTQYTGSWPGSAWAAPGQTRRIAVGFDALALATGLYSYTLDVHRITGASNTILVSFTGTLPIVNRSGSAFGAGWWLAGFEKLYFNVPSGQVLWVNGDGSVRRYDRFGTKGNDTAYIAAPVDHPDTLLHRFNGTWLHLLPGGAQVTFTSAGFHRYTTNRLGYVTEFVPDSNGLLDSLKIPPTGSGLAYDFTYSGNPLLLASVSVPDSAVGALRVTTLSRAGDTLSITDPGLPAAKYIYTSTVANRIVARKDRRGAKWSYTFDTGYRLSMAKLAVGVGDSITETFCSAEVRGIASCSPNLVVPESVYTIFDGPRTDSTDVTHFWPDGLGAVKQIRDPYGNITIVARADPRWPALATRVQHPNGWVLAARYDGRGNLRSLTDSSMASGSVYATSRYSWDQRWDQPTRVISPMGVEADFGYDATNGNRLWQQDIRGIVSRVTFGYYVTGNGVGLLKAVTQPGGATDSVAYDVRGNLSLTRTPLGWKTYFGNDRLGRLTVVRDSLETGLFLRDSTFYDIASRVVRKVTAGPARSGLVAQTVNVKNFFNVEGQLDSLQRWGNPSSPVPTLDTIGTITTRWRYDSAGRAIAEVAPDLFVDSTRYDPAGNAIKVVPRRGLADTITMVYDRMNRLVRRVTPQVTYAARNLGIATYPYFDSNCNCTSFHTYPWFPLDPSTGGPTIPADTAKFAYDNLGNLIRADNHDAFIRRTYLANGLLRTDTVKILTYSTRDSTKNVYGIEHRYDLQGRLSILKHPRQLAPRIGAAIADSVRYTYVLATGAIDTVIDPLGNRFQFRYNTRNDETSLGMPGGITDSLTYDLDGRTLTDLILNGSTSPYKHPDATLRQASFTYVDAQRVSQVSNAWGWKDTTTSTYSGLGQIHVLSYVIPTTNRFGNPARATSSETFLFDPLGNQYDVIKNSTLILEGYGSQRSPSSEQAFRYQPHTGRWWDSFFRDASRVPYPNSYRGDTALYNPSGDLEFSYQTLAMDATQSPPGTLMEDRAYFYGAEGKLRVTEYRDEQMQVTLPDFWDQHYTFEEFRYDALGRRVLVRTRRQECPRSLQLDLSAPCRLSTIRRTVWDGSRELYEIQMPGGDTDAVATMDNDTLSFLRGRSGNNWDPNPQFGIVAYTNGPATDQPLAVARIHFRDSPYNDSTHVWAPLDIVPQ